MKILHQRLPAMVSKQHADDEGFRKRNYRRWKAGMDLLKLFIVMSEELGSTFNERIRPLAAAAFDYKFEATVGLHARSLRVSHEIYALLYEGFPDGALSRWRTLHELAVVATFLSGCDKEISRRFIAFRDIETAKALHQYAEYLPRSNMEPLEPGTLEAAQELREKRIAEFGVELNLEMGWAFPAITKLNRKREPTNINLFDLEKVTGLDHWRPRFRWASDELHASPKPWNASLGTSESPQDQPVLLVGQSNSGFTDPAHMCVISLNLLNHALPQNYLSIEEQNYLHALRLLSDEVGEVFLRVQRAAP